MGTIISKANNSKFAKGYSLPNLPIYSSQATLETPPGAVFFPTGLE